MLEIIVSLLYFSNKIFLLFEKKAGWILGIMASSLAAVYFYYLSFYIFLSLEFACLTVMIFGLFGSKRSAVFSYFVYGIVSLVMLYLMFNIEESGLLEFSTSILFILAFLFLARDNWNIGWGFLAIAHSLMLIVLQGGGQHFFATMQGLSVVVCVIALLKPLFWKKEKRLDV